jgi:hypothetical protein
MVIIPSIVSLHLRYRLWIAEMNFDITILRIFDDAMKELLIVTKEPSVVANIVHFEDQFVLIRKEIDELKHEMHLMKMKLAAYSRETTQDNEKAYQADNHEGLETVYLAFRRKFDKVKNEFGQFESQLSH